MKADDLHVNILTTPGGTVMVGDVQFTYLMEPIRLEWRIDGIVVGSRIDVTTAAGTIRCKPGDVIPWEELTAEWSVGFPGGHPFCKGVTKTIESLEEWMHYLPLLRHGEALPALEKILPSHHHAKPLSWNTIQAISDCFDGIQAISPLQADQLEKLRSVISFYARAAAIAEMTSATPDPGAVSLIRHLFFSQVEDMN